MADDKDRLSELPDEIIQHILSFLPTKDVVQTCLLSKRWKLMWYTVPTLSFSSSVTEELEEFCNYVDRCLEHRKRGLYFLQHDSAITSFTIWMNEYERCEASCIDRWIAFAVEHKVKEIDLFMCKLIDELGHRLHYSLPVTLSVNASCLTTLKLNTVQLDSHHSFSFPSLKLLSLTLVRIADDDVVDKILLGSPCLEKFSLMYCDLKSGCQLNFRSSSLKFLKVTLMESKYVVKQIKAMNLESVELCGVPFCRINFSECKAIRSLSLACDWGMKESSSLECLISSLPLLEDLSLTNGYGVSLNRIKISSQCLKSFRLKNCVSKNGMTVVIESAPKLTSFYYKGDINFAMDSPNVLNGTFNIGYWYVNFDEIWLVKLINFLLNLNYCSWSMITLQVNSEKALTLTENLKRICRNPVADWEHIRVLTIFELERESDLRESLHWMFPSLKTLSIARRPCSSSAFASLN